ncbi:MAG: type II toxin-antitoxin system ParD family antitoxin [Bauldia sp.]|nr:type II toxin-antitoxin system ParD family antitoxin [Bauldia sp.]
MGRETSAALKLKELSVRAESWPEEVQEAALRLLQELEAELNAPLSDADMAAVQRGLEDVRQGRLHSLEEIRALSEPYRGK